jgi:hypothetical protein
MTDTVSLPEKPPTRSQSTVIDWSKAGTLTLVFAAPVFYLNGRAYHDGYLGYLNLDASMFPLQTTDFIGVTAVAWFRTIIGWFTNGFNTLGHHWLWAMLIVVAVSLLFAFPHFTTAKQNQAQADKIKQSENNTDRQKPSFLKSWGKVSVVFAIVLYAVFGGLLLISSILALVISPFSEAGRDAAKNDADRGFIESPTVALKPPGADAATDFRIIQCAAQFCAVFAEGKAYTVPVSAITWAVSNPAGSKPAGPARATRI